MDSEEYKQCPGCKEMILRNNFPGGGKGSKCKPCHAAYQREFRLKKKLDKLSSDESTLSGSNSPPLPISPREASNELETYRQEFEAMKATISNLSIKNEVLQQDLKCLKETLKDVTKSESNRWEHEDVGHSSNYDSILQIKSDINSLKTKDIKALNEDAVVANRAVGALKKEFADLKIITQKYEKVLEDRLSGHESSIDNKLRKHQEVVDTRLTQVEAKMLDFGTIISKVAEIITNVEIMGMALTGVLSYAVGNINREELRNANHMIKRPVESNNPQKAFEHVQTQLYYYTPRNSERPTPSKENVSSTISRKR